MIIDSLVGIFHHKEIHDGAKLDIAYVTPQLIASAMPTDQYIQGFYRMSAQSLVSYLNEKHGKNWHIWSLQEDKELGYDPQSIGGSQNSDAVSRFPIPDHQPISLSSLVQIATGIRQYIEESPHNVALVHCKCGKGRTGTVIVAYLMLFHGIPFEAAANEFTQKRIRLGVFEGISIRSQKRYLQYLERWIQSNQDTDMIAPSELQIVQLVIRNPKVDDFDVELSPVTSFNTRSYEKKRAWDVTFREKYYVLRPLDANRNALPSDLLLKFTGYVRKAGYRFATSSVTYALNANFEPNDAVGLPSNVQLGGSGTPLISSGASISPSIYSALGDASGLRSCICQWSDTDGLGGLSVRGIKAFDSIDIFWTKIDPEARNVESSPPAPVDYFAPPDIDNMEGI